MKKLRIHNPLAEKLQTKRISRKGKCGSPWWEPGQRHAMRSYRQYLDENITVCQTGLYHIVKHLEPIYPALKDQKEHIELISELVWKVCSKELIELQQRVDKLEGTT